jgi:hypothetical protein
MTTKPFVSSKVGVGYAHYNKELNWSAKRIKRSFVKESILQPTQEIQVKKLTFALKEQYPQPLEPSFASAVHIFGMKQRK